MSGPAGNGDGGGRRLRVLLIARDRRFRTAAGILFARRGSIVTTSDRVAAALELVRRHRADVVVLDASHSLAATAEVAAMLAAQPEPVGIVLVADPDDQAAPATPVIAKWGPFDALFDAVEAAYDELGWGGGRAVAAG